MGIGPALLQLDQLLVSNAQTPVRWSRVAARCSLSLQCLLVIACSSAEKSVLSRLSANSRLPALVLATDAAESLRWPTFLLPEQHGTILWAHRHELLRLRCDEASRQLLAEHSPVISLHGSGGSLVAGAIGEDGTIAVVDTSGAVHVGPFPGSADSVAFHPHRTGKTVRVAVANGRVFLLRASEEAKGPLVLAYQFDGTPAGAWGTMALDSLVQLHLAGGGIAACPNGDVYYSGLNSPEINVIRRNSEAAPELLGRRGHEFRKLSKRELRKAYGESNEQHTVVPLVKLGLHSSRVQNLVCMADGLVVRQVAQTAIGGELEVWRPPSGELLALVPTGAAVLLGTDGSHLVLGSFTEAAAFRLERLGLELTEER